MADHTPHHCNLCDGTKLLPLIDFGNHPVAKHYLAKPTDESPTWPVRAVFCETCGLTQLVDSCPAEILYKNYVTLSSWKYQPHVQHEIDVIKSLPGITNDSKIIEIGSNDGMFLHQMRLNGFKHMLGVEPAEDAYEKSIDQGIDTLKAFLTPALSSTISAKHGQFDLFISRQNLEHISALRGVIESIGILVKPNGLVLIEVPNFSCNLRSPDYGLWEEHVNYFTVDTLRHFMALAGVDLFHEESILFSGDSIFVIGRKTGNVVPPTDYVAALREKNVKYAENWPVFRKAFSEYLANLQKAGKKIAAYGAGNRLYGIVNFADVAGCIDVIVDDQLEKQNTFMPGGRIPVLPSDALYSRNIDVCLLAVNAEIEDKVIARHEKWTKNGGIFWSVLPPSPRLLPMWRPLGTA